MNNEEFLWTSAGWEDYLSWQDNKKILRKINELIKDIARNGLLTGIGKPEALKYRKGCYSRRIDEKNRLIYDVIDDRIRILGCRGHYDE